MAKKNNKINGLLDSLDETIEEVFTTNTSEATEEPIAEVEVTPEVTEEPEKKGGETPPGTPVPLFCSALSCR